MTMRLLSRAAAGVLALAAAAPLAPAAHAAPTPESFAPLADDLLPGVVNISTTQTKKRGSGGMMERLPEDHPLREFFEQFQQPRQQQQQQRQRKLQSLGSGFIVDDEGYIVTNNHVVEQADEITVILHDDRKFKAEVVGTDPETDMAVIEIDAPDDLTELEWGDSESARIGDWVMAIGNPFGLGSSVTVGIISARGRDINAGPYSRFIQTDTAINQGNSGGPLFNTDGEVIGVNTAILSPSGGSVGVGFALPSRVAEPVVADLKKDGQVSRGWLGVTVQPVTEKIADGLGVDLDHGALVGGIAEDSPARKSDLAPGDIILELEGEKVEGANDLARRVARYQPGETVTLKIWRDGERIERKLTLGERPTGTERQRAADRDDGDQPQRRAARAIGAKLAPVNARTRERFDVPRGVNGAVVAEVARNGPAASRGIRPGDVILKVGQTRVDGPGEVYSFITKALERNADSVVMLVSRDGNSSFIPVPLAKPER